MGFHTGSHEGTECLGLGKGYKKEREGTLVGSCGVLKVNFASIAILLIYFTNMQ